MQHERKPGAKIAFGGDTFTEDRIESETPRGNRARGVDDAEVREALQEPIGTIVNAIKVALENTPPELAGDIIDRGIVLTGGGSLLKGMDTRFREETNLPIITVDDPLTSVVLGVGKLLDELDLLSRVSVMSRARTSH